MKTETTLIKIQSMIFLALLSWFCDGANRRGWESTSRSRIGAIHTTINCAQKMWNKLSWFWLKRQGWCLLSLKIPCFTISTIANNKIEKSDFFFASSIIRSYTQLWKECVKTFWENLITLEVKNKKDFFYCIQIRIANFDFFWCQILHYIRPKF